MEDNTGTLVLSESLFIGKLKMSKYFEYTVICRLGRDVRDIPFKLEMAYIQL